MIGNGSKGIYSGGVIHPPVHNGVTLVPHSIAIKVGTRSLVLQNARTWKKKTL